MCDCPHGKEPDENPWDCVVTQGAREEPWLLPRLLQPSAAWGTPCGGLPLPLSTSSVTARWQRAPPRSSVFRLVWVSTAYPEPARANTGTLAGLSFDILALSKNQAQTKSVFLSHTACLSVLPSTRFQHIPSVSKSNSLCSNSCCLDKCLARLVTEREVPAGHVGPDLPCRASGLEREAEEGQLPFSLALGSGRRVQWSWESAESLPQEPCSQRLRVLDSSLGQHLGSLHSGQGQQGRPGGLWSPQVAFPPPQPDFPGLFPHEKAE